jgi:hypothetical protein
VRRLRVEIDGEAARGRHDLKRVADGEFSLAKVENAPAIHPLDADLKHPIIEAGTDRIGAPDFLPIEVAAEGQVLAGPKGEIGTFGRAQA